MDSTYYLSLFFDEGRERIQQLAELLVQLERAPGDRELLNDVFRTVHTFKGMADTMDFADLVALTHAMEGVLDALRRGRLELDPGLTRLLLRCLDALAGRIEGIEIRRDPHPADFAVLEAQLAVALSRVHPADPRESQPSSNGADMQGHVPRIAAESSRTFRIDIQLDPGCYMKSARALVITSSLETLGPVLDITPSLEELEWEDSGDSFTVVLLTDVGAEAIHAALRDLSEIAGARVEEQAKPLELADMAEVAEELVVPSDQLGPVLPRRAKTVRVEAERLDGLMDLMGALAVGQNRLMRMLERQGAAERPDVREAFEDLGGMTTRLREAIMAMRLVPLNSAFGRFPRVVRDLAQDLGKPVELTMHGGELRLDRLLVDELGELLVHLVRNALDHGVETPAERQAAGKQPVAHLRLEARFEGTQALIRIADDGRGIDVERVVEKAVARGLVSAEELRGLAEERLLDLVFLPGLSTTETATRLSGRGVGLDAVKTQVDALGGFVHLETRKGQGTTFELRFPLPRDLMARTGEPLEVRTPREP